MENLVDLVILHTLFVIGETSKTQLFNADHEEMANIERKANEMDSNVTQF